MRRRYVASTSVGRHVPAGNLAPLAPPPPPNILILGLPNIPNLPTPINGPLRQYSVYIGPSRREGERNEKRQTREQKISKQPNPQLLQAQ